MKESDSHRVISLVMAILMFFTSVGFFVDLHFCKGELKSFSLFGKAESCHTMKKSCPHHENVVIAESSEKDCCSNKTIEIDNLDTDFNVAPDVKLTDFQVKFVASFVYSFFSLSSPSVVKSTFYDAFDPLPPMDIYVLLERFLI